MDQMAYSMLTLYGGACRTSERHEANEQMSLEVPGCISLLSTYNQKLGKGCDEESRRVQ